MAGSIKWFKYTSDLGGVVYAVRADESNMEEVNGATGDYLGSDVAPVAALPRNVKPRTLRYVTADGLQSKRIIALTPAIFGNPPNPIFPDGVGGKEYRLRSYRGEEVSAPLGFDTGLIDGDDT